MTVAVLTLVRGRGAHLRNLVYGLSRGTRLPDELVIAAMDEDPPAGFERPPFPVRVVRVGARDEALPLAVARNAAARAAGSEMLVFLDVDCIPGSDLVSSYASGLARIDGLLMGGVRYLPPGAAEGPWQESGLWRASSPHPARTDPPGSGLRLTDRYEEFWSLSFAVRGVTFARLGGFDEGFAGYGAEDTDFAYAAREAGLRLAWTGGAWVFHQHHEVCDPPLQHLASIAANARRFRDKWGTWPMEGWLSAFASMGLILWEPDGTGLRVLRPPTGGELAAARRATAVPVAAQPSSNPA